ncbi:cell wall hydrolase [Mangrovicoccus algicola]|uniref:Cell wall hydrolase n=1 Tax=Mangrovicoccus algicola TaxID=2771008 RepID=A0A8J7CVG4_9RHOB|nr:cell wall hydrolase [Mangrovicoccus algicola]MBE3638699.1 cell wall hydrolase [Mangrovicoccus algicola]
MSSLLPRAAAALALAFVLLVLAPVPPAAAQSLFQGALRAAPGAGRDAWDVTGGGPLLSGAAAAILQARALPLTDTEGLARRRHSGGWPGRAGGFGSPVWQPPPARLLRAEAERLARTPPRDFSAETDLLCTAVSVYHEARNQPPEGQRAVAGVILNRVLDPFRWGMTPCEVVVPVQFSYLRPDRGFAPIRDMRAWAEAVDFAAQVLAAGPDPRLMGADHYHATYVDPVWNRDMDLVERIADHIFWRSRPEAS